MDMEKRGSHFWKGTPLVHVEYIHEVVYLGRTLDIDGGKAPFCSHHKQNERHIKFQINLAYQKKSQHEKIACLLEGAIKSSRQRKGPFNYYISTISQNYGHTMMYRVIYKSLFDFILI